MDPSQIPFSALVLGPTGCGKTKFVVDQLKGPFRGKFDYIVLLCPTYIRNRSWGGDNRFLLLTPSVDAVERFLRFLTAHFVSSTAKTLLILDDVACGECRQETNRLAHLVGLLRAARRNLRVANLSAANERGEAVQGEHRGPGCFLHAQKSRPQSHLP